MVEIDPVHVQALQRFLNRGPGLVRTVGGPRHAALRGDVVAVAPAGHLPQRDAEDGFAFIVAVARRRIEIVDPPALCIEHKLSVLLVRLRWIESHPPEANATDLGSRLAVFAVVHAAHSELR